MLTSSRLQALGSSSALYFAFSGQWANDNLDSAQKMVAGGPYTVRAYDIGVVSGDSGYFGTAEFRYDLGSAWMGQWQAVVFADSAHVIVNKNPWVSGANGATLSGVGAGLNWGGAGWGARAYVATPIGSTPVQVSSTKSTWAWVEVGMGF